MDAVGKRAARVRPSFQASIALGDHQAQRLAFASHRRSLPLVGEGCPSAGRSAQPEAPFLLHDLRGAQAAGAADGAELKEVVLQV